MRRSIIFPHTLLAVITSQLLRLARSRISSLATMVIPLLLRYGYSLFWDRSRYNYGQAVGGARRIGSVAVWADERRLTDILSRYSSQTTELLLLRRFDRYENGHMRYSEMSAPFNSPSWPLPKICEQMLIISAWRINMLKWVFCLSSSDSGIVWHGLNWGWKDRVFRSELLTSIFIGSRRHQQQ